MNTPAIPFPELPRLAAQVRWTRLVCRVSLGLVWVYEGLVPKLLFPHAHPEQLELVTRSHVWWGSPESTLTVLGVAQLAVGLLLLSGWRERWWTLVATGFMAVLIVLVAAGRPSMLTDPFGALAKDFCLLACAAAVWILPPLRPLAAAGK